MHDCVRKWGMKVHEDFLVVTYARGEAGYCIHKKGTNETERTLMDLKAMFMHACE